MTISLHRDAIENSTYIVTVSFKDSTGSAVAPTLASWSLFDEDGNIVNLRSQVDIPSPGSEEAVVLTDDDLALPDDTKPMRYLLIEALYDSVVYGNDLSLREEIKFKISNLQSFTPDTA